MDRGLQCWSKKNLWSYAAAKEAIRGLFLIAAYERAENGIRVNIVCALAFTEGVENGKKLIPNKNQELASKNPMQRFGDTHKIVYGLLRFF